LEWQERVLLTEYRCLSPSSHYGSLQLLVQL